MMFIAVHAIASNRRVLVHCAQGIDRSLVMVLVAICTFCELRNVSNNSESYQAGKELRYHSWCSKTSIDGFTTFLKQLDCKSKHITNEEKSSNIR